MHVLPVQRLLKQDVHTRNVSDFPSTDLFEYDPLNPLARPGLTKDDPYRSYPLGAMFTLLCDNGRATNHRHRPLLIVPPLK